MGEKPPSVFLFEASSLAQLMPERWWVPSPDLLDTIVGGRTEVKVLAAETGSDGGADLWSGRPVWIAVESSDGDQIVGRITASRLDEDGYRNGETIAIELKHIFDLVSFERDGRPGFNEARARFAIGKRVLVGLTTLAASGQLVERRQFVGVVTTVNSADGIALELEDGKTYWLPPDVRAFEEAAPGEYRLRSTGKVVSDPDYVANWTVTKEDDE